MKLKIVKYLGEDFWECVDLSGNTHRVDLVVGGGLDPALANDPHGFNGRHVEVESLQPYHELADGVRLLEET